MKIDPNELKAKKAHDVLTDIVMPRPIAFVSTVGEVVRIHIREGYIIDGKIEPLKLKLIGRLGGGGSAYCRTTDIFNIIRISLSTTKKGTRKQNS